MLLGIYYSYHRNFPVCFLYIPLIIILTFTIMFWFLWRSERFKIHGSDNKVIKDSGFMDFPVFLMPHQIMCVVVLCWNENVNSLTDTLNYSPKNTTSFFNFVKFPNRLYLKKHFPLNFSLEWGFLSKKVCVYVRAICVSLSKGRLKYVDSLRACLCRAKPNGWFGGLGHPALPKK